MIKIWKENGKIYQKNYDLFSLIYKRSQQHTHTHTNK